MQGQNGLGMRLHGEVDNESPELCLGVACKESRSRPRVAMPSVFWKDWGLPTSATEVAFDRLFCRNTSIDDYAEW